MSLQPHSRVAWNHGRQFHGNGLLHVCRHKAWIDAYPSASIEDGLAEEDWEGFRQHTADLGRAALLSTPFASRPA